MRDLVSSPRTSASLRRHRRQWLRLCAAMDAIGDTNLALRWYTKHRSTSRRDGRAYLLVYGALQALFVQQDAIATLAGCLKIAVARSEELSEIRRIRNQSIGHPTGKKSSAMIARMSLSAHGFWMIVYKGGKSERKNVDVRAAARRQLRIVTKVLKMVAEKMMEQELKHRRKFRKKPLAAVWATSSYMVEKVGQGLRDASAKPFAAAGLATLKNMAASMRAALTERGLDDAYRDTVVGPLDDLSFVIGRLGERLDGGAPSWTDRDTEVYRHYLAAKVDELKDLSTEIDAEYESDIVG